MGVQMFRIVMIAAAMLVSTEMAIGHESSSPPPVPKEDNTTMPQVAQSRKGLVLVDPKGMTLYYFDRDTTGDRSTCEGKCSEKFAPLAAPNNAKASGDFTLITRSDGSKMWAYRYRPLYKFHDDQAPGETHGTDQELLWHVARPE
jgi:predicted lipoprotein with Yx(FWY)xxD motif